MKYVEKYLEDRLDKMNYASVLFKHESKIVKALAQGDPYEFLTSEFIDGTLDIEAQVKQKYFEYCVRQSGWGSR